MVLPEPARVLLGVGGDAGRCAEYLSESVFRVERGPGQLVEVGPSAAHRLAREAAPQPGRTG